MQIILQCLLFETAEITFIQHMPLIERVVANEKIGELYYRIFLSRGEFDPAIPYEPKSAYDESLRLADIFEIYPVAWVDNLRVNEAYQHQGHGSWLLQKFEAACVEGGCNLAVLKVGWNSVQEMDQNLKFYANRGWKIVQPSPTHSYLAFKSL
jgi:GNAT superfamily N-acetyltransferase